MKNLKNQKGITLVALVVTIIVLLILAGVSLSLVAGSNGIMQRAVNAVEVNEASTGAEQAELKLIDLQAEYYEKYYVDEKPEVMALTMTKYIEEQLATSTPCSNSRYSVTVASGTVTVTVGGKTVATRAYNQNVSTFTWVDASWNLINTTPTGTNS